MDFYKISLKTWGKYSDRDYTIAPKFKFRGNDIICKGGDMFAFWYEGKWHTSKDYFIDILDAEVMKYYKEFKSTHQDSNIEIRAITDHSSGVMREFAEFTKLSPNSDIQFNQKIIFADEEVKREHYTTSQLNYTPSKGETPAFDEMFELLYAPEELEKIMWFIGAVLTNNMKDIQKFLFLYGGKGTGKGTILKVIKGLFQGYYETVDLKKLTSGSEFSTSGLMESPLLIDDDTDLYSIRDDTNLLKLTGHDPISINNKYQTPYEINFKGLLIAASNQPYRVRNVDSGITRRAVVAKPSNKKHDYYRYGELMKKMDFELPHIAQKAIDIFNSRGAGYYEDYVNTEMLEETDHFYNFMVEYSDRFGDVVTLKQASEWYKIYLEEIHYDLKGYKIKAREGLKRYYTEFYNDKQIDGVRMKNVFVGLDKTKFKGTHTYYEEPFDEDLIDIYELKEQDSRFDRIARTYPAQLANKHGVPRRKWESNEDTLDDLDTSELHYVQLPLNHIVIDLDIKNEEGEKDLYLNLKKVRELGLPETYMETSKSGQGIHLHYIYDGEPNKLDSLIEEDAEIKVFKGNSSLRRKLYLCNDKEMRTISTGLPEKEEEETVYKDIEMISWNEKKMRIMVKGNLEKKYHANTKPSVDFIVKIFKDAEEAGTKYDLKDMRQDILAFAASSSNQAPMAIKAVSQINFSTLEPEDAQEIQRSSSQRFYQDEELYFYDVEVFSNLFIIAWKKFGSKEVFGLINPTAQQVEAIIGHPLVGFNNRRYDNHIMYAAMLGEDNQSLYRQSQRIINDKNAGSGMYSGAYELSYTDIYDYSNAGNKKSLKKWEIELGIKHDEFELPWDQPVPEDMWERALEYCKNDVLATEEVFIETKSDYIARKILATLSGLSMNATTNQHTTAIVFEGKPRWETEKELVYTDLSETFPGYTYSFGKSEYKGIDPSEGGYVYAEPGVYRRVVLFDVKGMHPRSVIELQAFGKYTKNFEDLVEGRLDCKNDDEESLRKRFDGKLDEILDEGGITLYDVNLGLKTAVNSVYGLTSARFENHFRHPDNHDNIVAKRGALFMIELQTALQERGIQVVHIKTDSIKLVDPSEETVDFITEFGAKYGYEFDLEDTYERFALVNKSTYICQNLEGEWTAIGAQFAEPFVYKMLFTKEELTREDFFVTKQVRNAHIYLGETFVGSIAEVYASEQGQEMFRVVDDKKGAVAGTKGYKWKRSKDFSDKEDVDMGYYRELLEKAVGAIEEVGDASIMTDVELVTS